MCLQRNPLKTKSGQSHLDLFNTLLSIWTLYSRPVDPVTTKSFRSSDVKSNSKEMFSQKALASLFLQNIYITIEKKNGKIAMKKEGKILSTSPMKRVSENTKKMSYYLLL